MKRLLFLSCFAVLSSCCANTTDTPGGESKEKKKADIAGGVYNNETGKAINNVVVTAYSYKKEKAVLSDANGNFSFDDLKPGRYTFVFERSGFKKVSKEKTIVRADEGSQLNVYMEEHAAFDSTPGHSHFF